MVDQQRRCRGHASSWPIPPPRACATDSPRFEAGRHCDLGPFANLPDAERIVLNVHRAYADATGDDLDLVKAFTDAMAFNGGPMPTAV